MSSLNLSKVWRAWVALEEPAQVIPSYAFPRSVAMDGRTLRMEMEHCAELAVLARGKRPVLQKGDFTGFFACELSGTRGHLKTTQVGRSIDEDDINTCHFSAYAHQKGDTDADDVQVVHGATPSGTAQVCIATGGVVTASPDLAGMCLKVIVTYPQAIMASEDDIKTVCPHIVGMADDGTVKLVTFQGSDIVSVSDRKLTINVGIEQVIPLLMNE